LERLQSPIEYLVDNRFLEGLRAFAETCYSRVATIHHYMSLSKGSLGDIEEKGSYKLKKMFYALRAASACDWILNNDTVPPIQFKELMEGTVMKQSLKNQIYDLIDLKSGKSEAYLHQGEKEIFSYIHQQLDLASDKGATLPAGNYDAQEMDVFFVNVVKSQSSH
ncbi:MAG: nucleotidyltransferase domain-containing protein, partial [Flavobacteriales bacterium]|nr:nucleotidyltransferase domain-containing protein [Flavobacteriales bacterium]